MLGVVFHAVWTFVPRHTGAPIVDRSGNALFDWFFFTSHSFRMQVFFLIAGFFARMLYHRRGWQGFLQHRLARIAVPFAVGWLIVCPMVVMIWTWGGNVSGGNIPPVPLSFLLELLTVKGLMFVPRSSGGMFSLVHLWFLYYLLLIYALALVARAVIVHALPGANGLRRVADRAAAHIAGSPWSIVWLTVLTGLFLWRMDGWTGVDTPVRTLAPSLPVLLLYGSFFLLGWLWHRQSALLVLLARHWKWQLAAGLAVSVLCFVAFTRLLGGGYVAGTLMVHYPALTPNQVADVGKFAAILKSAATGGSERSEIVHLVSHLPEPVRAVLREFPPVPTPDTINGVCSAITSVLAAPGVFAPGPLSPANAADPQAPSRLAQNRATLERLLDGAIIADPATRPSYAALKLAYALGYAAMTWLMAFATLGIFQALCSGHSLAWRYVADSAYWSYLAHLPLVAALQVWMGAWAMPGIVKLMLMLAIAFAVLFASYHYLVRSTIIGQVLNGQRHPFTPWPLAPAPSRVPAPAPSRA